MNHPCGSLPVSGVHVSVWYCHHHLAWWATVSSTHQSAQEPIERAGFEMEWGPFDTFEDVTSWIADRLRQVEVAEVA